MERRTPRVVPWTGTQGTEQCEKDQTIEAENHFTTDFNDFLCDTVNFPDALTGYIEEFLSWDSDGNNGLRADIAIDEVKMASQENLDITNMNLSSQQCSENDNHGEECTVASQDQMTEPIEGYINSKPEAENGNRTEDCHRGEDFQL